MTKRCELTGSVIDTVSPPGAWAEQIKAAPWRFKAQPDLNDALARIRAAGLGLEADLIGQELVSLRAQVHHLLTYTPRGGQTGEK
jgi:hypothetical protein